MRFTNDFSWKRIKVIEFVDGIFIFCKVPIPEVANTMALTSRTHAFPSIVIGTIRILFFTNTQQPSKVLGRIESTLNTILHEIGSTFEITFRSFPAFPQRHSNGLQIASME